MYLRWDTAQIGDNFAVVIFVRFWNVWSVWEGHDRCSISCLGSCITTQTQADVHVFHTHRLQLQKIYVYYNIYCYRKYLYVLLLQKLESQPLIRKSLNVILLF